MKNLKTILMVSAMASVAFGGAVSALGKEVASPGGYDFTNRLPGETAWIDMQGQNLQVFNNLDPSPNLVSYWHAWYWNDDMGRRTNTTYIPSNKGTAPEGYLVYFSAYSNTGYVAVVEIQTAHYFYYVEFNAMDNKVSLTYNTSGGYPYFSAPHWTTPSYIGSHSISPYLRSMNIGKNPDGSLHIKIICWNNTFRPIIPDWTLPW